jgi:hypothetical protein
MNKQRETILLIGVITTKLSDPAPETLGRLQQSLPNYLNRPTAQRVGGLLQRPG